MGDGRVELLLLVFVELELDNPLDATGAQNTRYADIVPVDAELALLFSDRDGSPGVVDSSNPYYDADQSFEDFRDDNPDPTSNFTDAVSVLFR